MPKTRKRTTLPQGLNIELDIQKLGQRKIQSALPHCRFVDDQKLVIHVSEEHVDAELVREAEGGPIYVTTELAGPRSKLYFDTSKTKIGIVTCGGLCPGINDVIRSIVMEAHHNYNVPAVLGFRFGLQGFIPEYGHEVVELTPEYVASIHQFGGTILGSSRGPQDPEVIVDTLERMSLSVLFVIGGDGTMKAAQKIQEEVASRNLKISVIGIPKTIDNDINFVPKSFGFDTAVEKATEAISCAHVEATGVNNGIGLVKLMGRDSGFIAAQATLALKDVNIVLIPESPFVFDGPCGLLKNIERQLEQSRHCVIVCAEGAGQDLLEESSETDASSNKVLADICTLIRAKIKEYFAEKEIDATIKFIDPSYIIRSIPANSNDRIYCGFLGQNAVHAAMAGMTSIVVSKLQGRYVHIPLSLVTAKRRTLNVESDYWRTVVESTGQETLSFCDPDKLKCECE